MSSSAPSNADRDAYCRDIESYLCRKNDGHLIRIVGPSFELVSGWAARGIPIKIVYGGVDRAFERYYRKGPRRRPVKIDFCEADVLDVFDEWRRAVGLPAATMPGTGEAEESATGRRGPSLPVHLERVVLRLTSARASGTLGAAFDEIIDRTSTELDAARASPRGVRGEARDTLVSRLARLDAEAIAAGRGQIGADSLEAVARAADEELAPFRTRLAAEAFDRAREAAIDRIVRERLGLPTIAFG